MNDEMAMKRRGGTKNKLIVERMLNGFDLHFPTPAVEAMSRIARGLHNLTFVCKTKQRKSMQRYQFALNAKKSLCKWNSIHCRQKNQNLFVKL
jgi:hypothetical protein